MLLILIFGAPVAAYRINEARNEAVRQARTARLNQYIADINLADQARRKGDPGRSRQLLETHIPGSNEEDFRGWEWHYLWNQLASDASFIQGEHSGIVTAVDYSPNGKLVASSDFRGEVAVWNVKTQTQLRIWQQPHSVQDVLFYSDEVLVTANWLGTIEFLKIETGRIPRSLDVGARVCVLALSTDRSRLACMTGPDGGESVHLWNLSLPSRAEEVLDLELAYTLPGVDTGRQLLLLPKREAEAIQVRRSPDGLALAASAHDGFIWRALSLTDHLYA